MEIEGKSRGGCLCSSEGESLHYNCSTTTYATVTQEQAQLENIKQGLETQKPSAVEPNFEGGYGGQEDLEDRYATTCGEH